MESLDFVNKVGKISEEEGHHPDIIFGWGYAKINITTHAIEGLSENDFILAAKIDQIINVWNALFLRISKQYQSHSQIL